MMIRDFIEDEDSWIIKQNLFKLSDSIGTPYYLYDQTQIQINYDYMVAVIPENVDIYYAVKANPNPQILRILEEKGSKCEIASIGEFRLALQGGFKAEDIIFNGPGKSYSEIAVSMQEEIGGINVESFDELSIILKLKTKFSWKGRIGIRINPPSGVADAVLKTGGESSKFGIDLEELLEYSDHADKLELITVLHAHVGSRCLNIAQLIDHYQRMGEIFNQLKEKIIPNLEILDLGGGWGIPLSESENNLDLRKIRAVLTKLLENSYIKRIILEPGRFLVGNAGILVTKVLYIKESRGKKYAIVDAGTNIFARSSLVKDPYRVSVFKKYNSKYILEKDEKSEIDIVGPLCASFDWLAKSAPINVKSGDLIVVHSTGAYCSSAAQSLYMSRELPAEILVNGSKIRIIRITKDITNLYDNTLLTLFPRIED